MGIFVLIPVFFETFIIAVHILFFWIIAHFIHPWFYWPHIINFSGIIMYSVVVFRERMFTFDINTIRNGISRNTICWLVFIVENIERIEYMIITIIRPPISYSA